MENTYNYDVVEGNNPGAPTGLGYLYGMNADKIEKLVGMERWNLGTTGLNTPSNKKLMDASITGFQYSDGLLRSQSLHTLQTGSSIPYAAYTGVTTAGPLSARYNKIRSAYNGDAVGSFVKVSEVKQYDAKGNPLETQLLDQGIYKAMIWDTATGNKLAEVSNARYNEIAYTSFERGGAAGSTVTQGRISYLASGLSSAAGTISGNMAYALNALGLPQGSLNISGPAAGKTYILGFWAKGGVPAVFGYGQGLSVTALYSSNDWVYYQGKVSVTGPGTITLSASGATVYVDEVRLFPEGSMMQNWTYKPLCGASSATDAAGRITYYEYDGLGRPTIVRNQEGHILSRTHYVIY